MPGLHNHEKEELKKLLERTGRQGAENTIDILSVFLEIERHLSLAELKKELSERGVPYAEGEVERAMELFMRFGFAQAKDFNGGERVFEHKHLDQHHDHMVCTRCGSVTEFTSQDMEDLQLAVAQEYGFVPVRHRMDIYGLCRDCTRRRGWSIPLTQAEPGERVVVVEHAGGEGLARRLTDMGLTTGKEVEVLTRETGPVVVSCGGSRLALGQGMCDKIMVQPLRHGRGRKKRGWRRGGGLGGFGRRMGLGKGGKNG